MKAYFVYLMTNRSRVVLYTGATKDFARRVWEHQNSATKGFTTRYNLTILVHHETYNDSGDAINREKEIEGWRRSKKNALVENQSPKWTDLSSTLDPQCEVPRPESFRGSG